MQVVAWPRTGVRALAWPWRTEGSWAAPWPRRRTSRRRSLVTRRRDEIAPTASSWPPATRARSIMARLLRVPAAGRPPRRSACSRTTRSPSPSEPPPNPHGDIGDAADIDRNLKLEVIISGTSESRLLITYFDLTVQVDTH